jgi:hypothetical protein
LHASGVGTAFDATEAHAEVAMDDDRAGRRIEA